MQYVPLAASMHGGARSDSGQVSQVHSGPVTSIKCCVFLFCGPCGLGKEAKILTILTPVPLMD